MFFIDVQGTLLSDADKSLIAGAKELISFLNKKNLAYVIITNNTKKLDFLEHLRAKGLDIKDNAYIDPFAVLSSLLQPCKIAAFGSSEFKQSLEKLGFGLDCKEVKAVLVASFDGFLMNDFADMIELAKSGVRVIALHETSIYKKNEKLYPGVGAIMKMLEYASNASYEVVGKPSFAFYKKALELLKSQDKKSSFENTLIISDDFRGDLVQAKALGMQTALVLSGKISSTKNLDENKLDFVYPSVAEFLQNLKEK